MNEEPKDSLTDYEIIVSVPKEWLDKMDDSVVLVRCKDCKWCVEHYDTDGNVPYWICKNWYGGTDSDGYCHEAERK